MVYTMECSNVLDESSVDVSNRFCRPIITWGKARMTVSANDPSLLALDKVCHSFNGCNTSAMSAMQSVILVIPVMLL
jgi:hypothetical protein